MSAMDAQRDSDAARQRRRSRVLLWLSTVALLVLLPCLGLMASGGYLWARQAGAFSHWRSLGAPPGGGIEIVVGDTEVVYVRSAAGAVYGCLGSGAPDCWAAAAEPLQVDPEARYDARVYEGDVRPPAGTVVDTLEVSVWYAEDAFEARYVLLADGTVWKWSYDVGAYLSLFVLVLGLAAGAVVALLAIVVLWLCAWRRSRQARQ